MNVGVGQKTLDDEHVAALRCDVEGCVAVLALDVDKDVLPLQQLSHRHRLVRHHAQRGLLEAVWETGRPWLSH